MTKKKTIVVSGIQPTGDSHLGTFAGAYMNWLRLQEDPGLECWFFIADYHSLSEDYDPAEKRRQILGLAADFLAIGLDPTRCTLFLQSDVPETTELCWIFNTLTPVSHLERMTQFKDKSAQQKKNINMGLLDYPVLQAADILLYGGTGVPVGIDQVQHVELTRDIARFFNNKYGADLFAEPKPLLTEIPKLRSLADPLRKMSKSHGEKTLIALKDDPETILAKVKRAVTETSGVVGMSAEELEERMTDRDDLAKNEDELRGAAGVHNLLAILSLCGKDKEAEAFFKVQPMKYGELKKMVAEAVADRFADFRKRRAELAADPEKVEKMLADGGAKARAAAQDTMTKVRKAIGIR